jgi:RNA polymerase-binding transcription factor DksA
VKRDKPPQGKKSLSAGGAGPGPTNGRGGSNGSKSASAAPGGPAGGNGESAILDAAKAHLSDVEREFFRGVLLEARGQLVGDVNHMEGEALKKNRTDAAGDLSLMPIHMADIGTDAYEQEFTIGLIENETETLREIDAALERLRNGTYGICEATGKPIGKARLKVMPWARYCVAHERTEEDRRNRRR